MSLLGVEALAVSELCAWLRSTFAGRVDEIALFGSRARGDAREDSDIDVLIVIEALTSKEAREIAYFCGDLLTRHDVIVSTFAVSREHMEQLRRRERLIATEIDRDGVPL